MVLTRERARSVYDWIGARQDTQAFYEDAALDELMAQGAFESASSVFEFGCGTGRLALRLLTDYLPDSASYLGFDISPTMVDIARKRLAPFAERAEVVLSDGSVRFPPADHSVDRVVSTYVLDLLSEADIAGAISEAHRILSPNGKLCLVSLTTGKTVPSRMISGLWSAVCRLYAPLVGGCRPIELAAWVGPPDWTVDFRKVISQWGVSSEVLIATPGKAPE
jgi:ubiquinone/menaquinone biosynthesis C-methylase UbiE